MYDDIKDLIIEFTRDLRKIVMMFINSTYRIEKQYEFQYIKSHILLVQGKLKRMFGPESSCRLVEHEEDNPLKGEIVIKTRKRDDEGKQH